MLVLCEPFSAIGATRLVKVSLVLHELFQVKVGHFIIARKFFVVLTEV
jgi:hypothetical protein